MAEDWLSRVNIPDVYPRRDDPFKPKAGYIPTDAPPASYLTPEQLSTGSAWEEWYTVPATRPIVYQRAVSYSINVGTVALPLANAIFQCETIMLNVLSTAANSVFLGFGNGVTVTSGIEIRPGIPVALEAVNEREMWEIQRLLEAIAGMMATERGYNAMGPFRAPRVVFSANDYYVIAAAATTLRVMLFTTPEFQ